MLRKTTLILPCLIFIAHATHGQHYQYQCYHEDHEAHERNKNINVSYMRLDVSFEPKAGIVNGKVLHQFKCLQNDVDTIFFDAPKIYVKSVLLDGKPIGFDSIASGLVCKTGLKTAYQTEHTIEIVYRAKPKRGIYFIGWELESIPDPSIHSRRQIWTQGQGIDNRHWIPMIDDRAEKFVTEVFVTFDKDYNVLSNGQLLSNKVDGTGKNRIWNYKINNPHSGYLLTLAIDKYAIKKTNTKRGTPIQFWYYPEHPDRVEPTSRYSENIIEFLEEETGIPYPWGSYSQVMVQDFLYGAMENTSATTFGDFFWVDNRAFLDRNYVVVNAHEATHQWFGDLITARHDGDHWLQESFATFYPGLFLGKFYSSDDELMYFRGNMNNAISAGEKNSLPVRHSQGGTARHYPKGASVLYMLQHIIGRDNFKRGIELYLKRHGFTAVETEDLQKAFMDATGINLDWFFDQWIYRGGEPEFTVQYQNQGDKLHLLVQQTHKREPTVKEFTVPVDIAIYYENGEVLRKQVVVKNAFDRFEFTVSGSNKIAFVLFDEGSFVLKKIIFKKSKEELTVQAKMAKYSIDRIDAISALAQYGESQKKFFEELYIQEPVKFVRAEIVKHLAKWGISDPQLMNEVYASANVEIRRALIENTIINVNNVNLFEKALKDSSYSIIESALTQLMEFYADNGKRGEFLNAIQNLDGHTNNLKIKYLEYGTEVYPDMKGTMIAQITNLTSNLFEFRTRIAAMQAIQRLGVFNEKIALHLLQAATSSNGRLAGPAKDVLQYFKAQTNNKRLIKFTIETAFDTTQQLQLKRELGF